MDALYEFAQRNAIQKMNAKPDAPVSSAKIQSLEQELRSDTMEQKTAITSELAGNASKPTREQGIRLERIGEQQSQFHSQSNPLGDYSTLLKQMQEDITGASNAMLYSTLGSKTETQKLATANEQYNMIASQFNLANQSEKSFKNAKKYKRLSSQDSFL